MGIIPKGRQFVSCYSIRNPQHFQFYLQARTDTKQLSFFHPANKVNDWDERYLFLQPDEGHSVNFCTEWKQTTPLQLNASNFWLDDKTKALNELFNDGAFNLTKMCKSVSLLSFWGLLPSRKKAQGNNLGDTSDLYRSSSPYPSRNSLTLIPCLQSHLLLYFIIIP